jgi:CO/xanthine dehydrogenase FAD-binding subunit
VDLDTVEEVVGAAGAGAWRAADGWLAGGTYLFSEPQPHLRRLRDLTTFGWPPLTVTPDGLEIAATCTIAELSRLGRVSDASSQAPPLVLECCQAFLASFKVWNVATVGGNLCAALPAGPMISLTASLDGWCVLEALDGSHRHVAVTDFVTGAGETALAPGEFLRSIFLTESALKARTAFRQGSLYPLGRSAALVIGRVDPASVGLVLTVTASTLRPVQLRFAHFPSAGELRVALEEAIPAELYVDDVHGLPAWRRHLTLRFATEIRQELAA